MVAVATSELEGEFDVVANLGVGGGVPGGPGFTKRTPFRSVPKTWTTTGSVVGFIFRDKVREFTLKYMFINRVVNFAQASSNLRKNMIVSANCFMFKIVY